MMEVKASDVMELRKRTGCGVMECKKALQECNGDLEKAQEYLRKLGAKTAESKAGREVKHGVIAAYVHADARKGAMVELLCETDFVSRLEEFRNVAKELAMQVVASKPLYLTPEDVPEDVKKKEEEIYREQMKDSGKPPQVIDRIVQGKMMKFYQTVCLMEQPYIREPKKYVKELINELIQKVGENVKVGRFARFEL